MRYLTLFLALLSLHFFHSLAAFEDQKYYLPCFPDYDSVVNENSVCIVDPQEFSQCEENCESECANYGWCKLIAGAVFGKFIGLEHGYAEFGFMGGIPLQERAQAFGDARAFKISNNHWSGSLGLGYRYSCENVCENHYELYGLNIYYDYLETKFDQDLCCGECTGLSNHSVRNLSRIGVGLEYLSTCFDFRMNAYIPINKTTHYGRNHTTLFEDGFKGSYRNAMSLPYGVDGEIGSNYRFYSDYFNAYLGVGGYYYKHRDFKEITGVMTRFELSLMEFLSLQFLYSYDRTYSSKYQGKILFSIPLSTLFNYFSSSEDTGCYIFDPWSQLVKRNDVPFVQSRCCWKWNW